MSSASDEDIQALVDSVPPSVVDVCRTLKGAGFEAYTVGGAVRDALLGRPIGDWDVTTSAHPGEVIDLFDRTLPTGLAHGTVTVMVGRGAERQAVEVTSFRGEGAYTDARRPDEVVFGVPLDEDLARRDFVINAMAYDPIARIIRDPFGGRADLANRVIRAVGDPRERFAEDGLRVMRAIRFVAVLSFDLDQATREAIEPTIPSLVKVSRERVRVELVKTLASARPSTALQIAIDEGVIAAILPELAERPASQWNECLRRIDDADADPVIRLAAMLLDVEGTAAGKPDDAEAADHAETLARRLKLSNAERERVVGMLRYGQVRPWLGATDQELRRHLSVVGRRSLADLIRLWQAEGEASGRADVSALAVRAGAIAASGCPLSVGELAISGGQLITQLGVSPGPRVGSTLRALFQQVLDDPALNRADTLLGLAAELLATE